MCRRKHEFNAVQLVDFASPGVVVNSDDIGCRVALTKLFNYAFANYVVWQAAEWLGADDVWHVVM